MKSYEFFICLDCGHIHTLNELEWETYTEPHGERVTRKLCTECGSDEIDELSHLNYSSALEFATVLYEGRGIDIEDLEDGEEILADYEEMMGLYDDEEEDIDLSERDDFFKDIANKVELIGVQ